MKKFSRVVRVVVLFTFTLLIASCGFSESKVNQTYEYLLDVVNFDYVNGDLHLPTKIGNVEVDYFSENINILTHDGKVTRGELDQEVILNIIFTYNNESVEKQVKVTIIKEIEEFNAPFIPEDMLYLHNKLVSEEVTMGLPASGDVKALVIPIDFPDYRFTSYDVSRIEKAFFGTEIDTGWESVNTYYKKSSYNQLNITGHVTEVYSSSQNSTYYTNVYNRGDDADYMLIKDTLEYFDPIINFDDYDLNNDGYIDALYFIYSTPVYYGDSHIFDKNQSDLWWAYVYQYYTKDYEYYDGVEANYYLWAGYDFMDEAFTIKNNNDKFLKINTSTYIHETGHMLGLEDYYDYYENEGPEGGLGGADMMDYNVGDHSSFTKIMMNWTNPVVASSGDYEIKIKPFESSGDVILVTNDWSNSYFDEYFLIDYYTPTGLNAAQAGYNGLFSISGIRIYHVYSIIDPTKGKQYNDDGYYSMFSYNNSDTQFRLISLIEADDDDTISKTWVAEDGDLFQQGQVFGGNVHTDYLYYNRKLLDFIIEIKSITPNEATIRISSK